MADSVAVVRDSRARIALLAACVLSFVLLLWDLLGAPHFYSTIGWERDEKYPVATVTYIKPGFPAARAGLRPGDKVDYSQGTFADRLVNRLWLPDRQYVLSVQRGSLPLEITIVPVVSAPDASFWLDLALYAWMTGFALVLTLRATGRRALLLAWLLLTLAAGGASGLFGNNHFFTPFPWLNEFAYLLSGPANGVAAALLATISSTFARPISPLRRVLEIAAYVAAAVAAMTAIWFEVGFLVSGVPLPSDLVQSIAWCAAFLLAAVCALSALAVVRGDERQRAAWLLLPVAVTWMIEAFEYVVLLFAGGYWSGAQLSVQIAADVAIFAMPVLLTYAVMRRHLLDVDFVMNRAAVFAGVSLVVIGAFVLAEWLINRFFVEAGRSANVVVSLLVALALGVSLRFIHRYVDRFVDRTFFRTRHEHERSMRAFAHEAAYITDYDRLLDDTVREVSTNAETDRVSILLRDAGGEYSAVRGAQGAFDRVNENDRAVVKMRTWHCPVDLESLDTELTGARAYPMMSRGDLLGILVCGAKRDGQGYAPDESEALATLALGVGAALGSLQPSRNDYFLDGDMRAIMYEIRDALRVLKATVSSDASDASGVRRSSRAP